MYLSHLSCHTSYGWDSILFHQLFFFLLQRPSISFPSYIFLRTFLSKTSRATLSFLFIFYVLHPYVTQKTFLKFSSGHYHYVVCMCHYFTSLIIYCSFSFVFHSLTFNAILNNVDSDSPCLKPFPILNLCEVWPFLMTIFFVLFHFNQS